MTRWTHRIGIALFSLTSCAQIESDNLDIPVDYRLDDASPIAGPIVGSIDIVREEHLASEPILREWSERVSDNPTIIYLNRSGASIRPGANDSRANVSSIVARASTLPAWNVDAEEWREVVDCVADLFAPFDVRVTDVDPGSVPHFESMIGGRSSDLGYPGGIAGLSPFTSSCDVIPNSVVYTFADALPKNSPRLVCEITAQEIAHSFGLDHQFLCTDPMSYLWCDQQKQFTDKESPCGEFEARACKVDRLYDCGRTTQNSYQELAKQIGFAGGSRMPSLTVDSPEDEGTIASGTTFEVNASDDGQIQWVDFSLDGKPIQVDMDEPYQFKIPVDLKEGRYSLSFAAQDDEGFESSIQLSVRVVEPGHLINSDTGTPGTASRGQDGSSGGCGAAPSQGRGALALALCALAALFRRREPSTPN